MKNLAFICLSTRPPSLQAILDNNVAYDIMAHTFFLEDGIETGNIFNGNLGFVTRASQVRGLVVWRLSGCLFRVRVLCWWPSIIFLTSAPHTCIRPSSTLTQAQPPSGSPTPTTPTPTTSGAARQWGTHSGEMVGGV